MEVLNIFIRGAQIYQRFKNTYVIIYVKQVWLFKLSSFKTIKYDFISGTYRSFNTFPQNKDEIANDLLKANTLNL